MTRYAVAVLLVSTSLAAPAEPASTDLREAIANGKASLGFRYRFEEVDQADFGKDAKASTARARMTWNSAAAGAVTLGVEADYALILGIDSFNSTTNGRTQYPVVADPEGFDLNQAFVKYASGPLTVTTGRQRIIHGTQRMVGGVAFRQNEQTYDAVRVQRAGEAVAWEYTYLHNVNRIFGPDDGVQPGDWYGNSHLFRATADPADNHAVTAFAYLLDFQNANGPQFSNATYGIEYEARVDVLNLHASVARQSDWGDNPLAFDAFFYSLQGDFALDPFTLTLGLHHLGSDDGAVGFRTPIGTLHKWQGWTDKFLLTPDDGLQDRWIAGGTKLGGANVTLVYHDFRADEGGADYGSEVGLSLTYPIRDNLDLLVKTSRYSAEAHAADTTKFWLMLDWKM